ncbi:MAG: pilus assembly protein [Rhodobacterales bacterium]|nr:pilus assembly protein [Rhodobacterales bacterium]
MIRHLKNKAKSALARFVRDETANATVEFAILFPAFITILLSSVELGMYTVRHTMLERGLDMAVRDVRLGTGTMTDDQAGHDELKAAICGYAGLIPDCENNLKLEMIPLDLRAAVAFPNDFDCVDRSELLNPVRTFINGLENELMLLQACVQFDPIFPTTGMGSDFTVDGSGMASMYAASAFVQEPL